MHDSGPDQIDYLKSKELSEKYLFLMEKQLFAGLEHLLDVAREPNNRQKNVWSRVVIRSFFSDVECLTYIMRQMILRGAARQEVKLPKEINRTLKGWKKISSANRFLVTFKYFHKLYDSTQAIDPESKEWKSFDAAIDIRNRMTHPKRPEDLIVKPREAKQLKVAMTWFFWLLRDTAKQTGLSTQREVAHSTPPVDL